MDLPLEVGRRLDKQGALVFANTDGERKVLEAAHGYMADENGAGGFLFSGWCQTALPHRKLPDDTARGIKTDYVRLIIEPGSIDRDDGVVRVEVIKDGMRLIKSEAAVPDRKEKG